MVVRVHFERRQVGFAFVIHWLSSIAGLLDGSSLRTAAGLLARRAISARWLADKAQCDRCTSSAARDRAHPNDRACARSAAVQRRVLPSSEILKEAVPTQTLRSPTRRYARVNRHAQKLM